MAVLSNLDVSTGYAVIGRLTLERISITRAGVAFYQQTVMQPPNWVDLYSLYALLPSVSKESA